MDRGEGTRPGQDPGPVVRPYALTGGRTEPANGEILDLVAIVVADTALPLGVVRVLLADLLVQGRLKVVPPQADDRPRAGLLEEVLQGLRAL